MTVRVGVVGPQRPDRREWHVADALPNLDCEPIPLGSAVPVTKSRYLNRAIGIGLEWHRARERQSHRIVNAALQSEVDAVLTFGNSLTPRAVSELRRNNLPVALWHPDAISNHARMEYVISDYSALFFNDANLVERLRAMLDLPAYELAEACNPRFHRPLGRSGSGGGVVLAGNMYSTRVRLLDRLVDAGFPLEIYGAGFSSFIPRREAMNYHTGRVVFLDDKARAFRESAFVLNNLHPATYCANSRLFEAAACGAIVLTEYRPGLEKYFAIGSEILAFRNFDELVALGREILNDPEGRAGLGDAASKRAHRDHNYENRLSEILSRIVP